MIPALTVIWLLPFHIKISVRVVVIELDIYFNDFVVIGVDAFKHDWTLSFGFVFLVLPYW